MTRRAVVPGVLVVGALAVLAGILVLVLTSSGTGPVAGAAPVGDRGHVPSTHRTAETHGPDTHRTPSHHSSPTRSAGHPVTAGSRLRFPGLHVDADLGRVRVRDGVMGIPADPRWVGWWRGSAAPGAAHGSVVVVGHINYGGVDGALSDLASARPGQLVTVHEPRHAFRYRVAAVRTYPKSSGVPSSAFASTGAPRLVLITCGGPFDSSTGNYEDNVVVYAVPA